MTKLIEVLLAFSPAAHAEAAAQSSGVTPFIPLLFIFAIFYFLILRPQQAKQRLHEKFLTEIKRGDVVVTAAGIIGTIRTVSEKFVTLEVDDGVCLKILKSQISDSARSLADEKSKASIGQLQEERK